MKYCLLIVLFCGGFTGLFAQSVLYFLDGGGIEQSRTDGTQRQVVIPGTVIKAQGLAIDVANDRLYWTDWVNDKIQTSNLQGQQITDLVTTGLQLPEGIALDTMGGKMYWVDSGTRKIQRANLDGTGVEDLVSYTGSVSLDGIALDPNAGHMYWTDWGAGAAAGRVRRAKLDGTQIVDLVTKPNGILKGIALDLVAGKVYWTDCGGWAAIQRANLNGTNIEDLLVTGVTTPNSIVLDIGLGKMYWTDLGTKKVLRANLDGTVVEDVISQNLNSPEGVSLTQCREDGTGCLTLLPTSIRDAGENVFTIAPNPASESLSIKGLQRFDELVILDFTGRELIRKTIQSADLKLTPSRSWPSGIYLVRISRSGREVGQQKLIWRSL